MFTKLRARLTYANVMATVAVFIALGGSSYAAITITGKNVKNRSLTAKDIKKSSLTTREVKNRSLLAQDFKAGQLPAGPRGQQGVKGDKGAPGQDGLDGTARAYAWGGGADCAAVVFPDTCPLHKNKGVAYIIHVGNGVYCVGVNGIDASAPDSLAIVAPEESSSTANAFAEWRAVNNACVANEFEVATFYQPEMNVRNEADNGSVEISGPLTLGGTSVSFSITIP